MTATAEGDDRTPVRLDKWLRAARFFKTRGLAAQAVAGGLVHLNGARTKAAKAVRVGDELTIRRGPAEVTVIVRALAERRGPATDASRLYEETESSRRDRERAMTTRRAEGSPSAPSGGRPTKKGRRDLLKLRRG